TPHPLTAPLLRRNRPDTTTLHTTLAQLHTTTNTNTWTRTSVTNTNTTTAPDLPTYAFQHQRYWLNPPTTTGDLTSAGLTSAEHPLLRASVELADGLGTVFTGQLSLRTHPWLADHTILGTVLLPGTAFLDLALHAGNQLDAPHVEELTLEAPLALPEQGTV
ncbi:polyketide synthase dehydratase domain-containing protein, partial [Streptomyces sp. NRRL F-525]|uniref:polyketide synthase dehydratase domain-containing protein n=1 Tax=Streptomyces sp. NRRL F-525 TaxID=1463861 RepID=UPI0005242E90